ncbi:unnamed protein product [Vicia faba]|uniref:Uncharacterized protein n=1 Tax=Vicia faba TaxID=3906 RepID=A0AAV0Z0M7_VICFA|nr:unnamed protein product [Vicia faba]
MAYYDSSYSGSDYGEYNSNSYPVNYDYNQVPSFMTYNSYDYNQPNYGYDSSSYFSDPSYSDHSYNNNHQTIAYSTTCFSDPKYLVYDPNYGMTQLVLSYSTLEFNEPAFDEYDPTPYGGGYDIVETYGKPQPPSDKICYPKVILAPNPTPIPVPVHVPVPSEDAKIEEKVIKPQNETIDQIAVEKPKSEDSTIKETIEVNEGEESEDSDYSEENDAEEDDDDNNNSGSSYEKEVTPPQYPSGYGLETVDICESLFGYWPCLAKMKRESCCNGSIHRENNCQENMWKGTADYLFGNPYPYGGRRDDDYGGEFFYGYERH